MVLAGQLEVTSSELTTLSWVTPPSHMATLEPLTVWRASVTACHDEIGVHMSSRWN